MSYLGRKKVVHRRKKHQYVAYGIFIDDYHTKKREENREKEKRRKREENRREGKKRREKRREKKRVENRVKEQKTEEKKSRKEKEREEKGEETMIMMEQILQEKKQELEKMIEVLEERQMDMPEGSLRIAKNGKKHSFYHYLPGQKEKFPLGKYISRKQMGFVKALAQKDYDSRVLKWAKECHAKLERLQRIYQDEKCAEIYEALGSVRRELIKPYELPTQEYVKQWREMAYHGKDFPEEANAFLTENGEKVRSKSEKILADKFLKKGIPYKYECPLHLKGYGMVYPDFTLLNRKTRQVFYWEHLGMMDYPEYAQKAIAKIQTYEQNGIYPGKQLLLSYEIKNSLNMQEIDSLILEYLG